MFADVYQVCPRRSTCRGAMTPSPCAAPTITLPIKSIATATTLEFISDSEDPVTITLTDESAARSNKGHHLGALTAVVGSAGGAR